MKDMHIFTSSNRGRVLLIETVKQENQNLLFSPY